MILPMIGLFLVDDPHDCYTCLGKDPDRIYSSFQLSREQRAERLIRAHRTRSDAHRIIQRYPFMVHRRDYRLPFENSGYWDELNDTLFNRMVASDLQSDGDDNSFIERQRYDRYNSMNSH